MFTSFLSTAHDQCFQNLGSFLTKFDDDDLSTGRFFVTDRPIVVARCCSVTCIKSESLALSLAAACVLSCPPKCASRGCVCVWCVLLLSSLSAGLFRRARCTEEAMGSRWENSPPTPKKKKKKCGFIAASLGQRARGVSLPRHTIISWALSTERNMAWRQRGRAKDRDDGADTKRQHKEMRKWEDVDNKSHIVFH